MKSKPQMTETGNNKVSMCHDSIEDTRELTESINNFPITNQPISDAKLKDMLVSLRNTLHADMLECMRSFKYNIGELGGRIDHVEENMGEFASSYNSLVDAHNDQAEKVTWLRAKVADLEDRSHRHNIKIRGIPEATQSAQLQQHAQDLMKAFLPSLSDSDLLMDRIHYLSKPPHIPHNVPRDVLMRVTFFHVQEQFMTAFHNNKQPPERYSSL